VNVLDVLALSSPQQRVLRGVELAAPLLFLAAVPASGGVFHPVFTAVGGLLAVLVALLPETNAALGLVVYLGALWMLSTPSRLDLWTLAAAVLLCALHLACTLSSYGPPGLRLDPVLVAVWRRRSVLCVGAGVLVWASARVVGFLDLPASGVAVGLGLLVVLSWVALLTVRLAQSRSASGGSAG
jgi:hypothetical protein